MKKKEELGLVGCDGNAWLQLGFTKEEAEDFEQRAEVLSALRREICEFMAEAGNTKKDVISITQADESTIDEILRGKFLDVPTDRVIRFFFRFYGFTRFGIEPRTVKPKARSTKAKKPAPKKTAAKKPVKKAASGKTAKPATKRPRARAAS